MDSSVLVIWVEDMFRVSQLQELQIYNSCLHSVVCARQGVAFLFGSSLRMSYILVRDSKNPESYAIMPALWQNDTLAEIISARRWGSNLIENGEDSLIVIVSRRKNVPHNIG